VKWRFSSSISGFNVGTVVEEQLGDLEVAVSRGPVQRRLSTIINRLDGGAVVKEQPGDLEMAVVRGPVQRRVVVVCIRTSY
jgi:hypothetical protein